MPFPYTFPIIFGVNPALTVVVGGEIPDLVKGSLMVELRIEERSVAEFTIVDILETDTYQRGQPVSIYDTTDTLIFGGFIDSPEIFRLSPKSGLLHHIRCMDNHYLADKRLIALSYLATAAGTIVEGIRTNYLADEGVTVGNIEAGPDIVEAVFNYVRASDALDTLAEKSNKIWYIDENKALYFVARDTTPADWNAVSSDITKGTALLSGGNPLYRNRQYIRGGRGTTTLQTEVFIGDGQQVAFTVGHPFQQEPVSVTDSVLGAMSIGIKGIDEAEDCYWNKGDATLTFTVAPVAPRTITVEYYGQYPILVEVEDTDEIAAQLAVEGGGTGYVDEIADEPTLNDKDASIDSGKAKLARFGVPGKRFLYQVIRTGLKPGQLQSIDYPSLGLNNEQLLIESVMITGRGDLPTYDIVAIQGPEIGGWSKFFKSLVDMKQEVIERLNVGSDQLLIILVDFEENVEVSEAVSDIVTQCLFPAADLYPEATIYPC